MLELDIFTTESESSLLHLFKNPADYKASTGRLISVIILRRINKFTLKSSIKPVLTNPKVFAIDLIRWWAMLTTIIRRMTLSTVFTLVRDQYKAQFLILLPLGNTLTLQSLAVFAVTFDIPVVLSR